jgi:hypothetical protein
VQQHDTAGKADEMLVKQAKRHEKLRRSKGSSDWDLGHGPDQLQKLVVKALNSSDTESL